MTPDLEAIVARHVKTIEEVHWPSGLVTHPESCLTCDKAWPCDARQLADALTAEREEHAAEIAEMDKALAATVDAVTALGNKAKAAEARVSEALEERDAVRGAGNALLDVALAERDAAEADADALAEALRGLIHKADGTPNVLRDDFPDGGDIVLRWEGNRQDWQHAIDSVAAHDARRQPDGR